MRDFFLSPEKIGKEVKRKDDKLKIQNKGEEISPEIIDNHDTNEIGFSS